MLSNVSSAFHKSLLIVFRCHCKDVCLIAPGYGSSGVVVLTPAHTLTPMHIVISFYSFETPTFLQMHFATCHLVSTIKSRKS